MQQGTYTAFERAAVDLKQGIKKNIRGCSSNIRNQNMDFFIRVSLLPISVLSAIADISSLHF